MTTLNVEFEKLYQRKLEESAWEIIEGRADLRVLGLTTPQEIQAEISNCNDYLVERGLEQLADLFNKTEALLLSHVVPACAARLKRVDGPALFAAVLKAHGMEMDELDRLAQCEPTLLRAFATATMKLRELTRTQCKGLVSVLTMAWCVEFRGDFAEHFEEVGLMLNDSDEAVSRAATR